jgi:PAS domain S-box-containing protein
MDQQKRHDVEEALALLKEENRQQQEEFSQLLSISKLVVSELDVKKVFDLVAKNVRQIVNADLVLVPMLNKERDHYTYVAGSGADAALVCGTTHKATVGMCGWVLQNERSLLFGETSPHWMEEKTPWESGQQSAVLVPLFGRDGIIGGLTALGKHGGEAFTRHDLDLLTVLANQVSIAIENALMFEQRCLVEEGLKAVNECLLSFGVDPLQNLKAITHTTGEILNAAYVLYNRKDGELLQTVACWQVPEDMPLSDKGEGRLCFDVINQEGNDPMVVLNLQETTYAESDPNVKKYGLALFVGYPVRAAGQPALASLCALFQKPMDISPYQLSLLRVLGKAAAVEEERLRADIALRASEARFRTLIENASVGILATEIDTTRFLYANSVICRMLGYQKSELLALNIWDIHPKEELRRIEQKFSACEPVQTFCLRRDGTQFAVDIKPIMVELDGGTCLVGFFTDVSDRHLLEMERFKTQKLESVGVLAGGIAHDFNNILSAILGNINLASFDKELNDRTRKLLSEAEKASLRARDLTQQLLTFAKGGDPVKKLSSLESVIKDSATFVLHGGKVSCSYDIPEDLWLVDIDKGQIGQVVQNIVLNASHAMPGGGTVKITCENSTDINGKVRPHPADGRYVKLSIQDSGKGIPENIIGKIFDPYFTTKQRGSGLGLAITQSIITKHNGYILVDSSPCTGTTFIIYLPAAERQQEKHKGEKAIAEHPSQKAKILVMDDNEMVRDVAKSMLDELNHEVVFASDGEEAVKLYRESLVTSDPFELIIMDLTIPGGMGGEEAVKEIHAINLEAKVIVSSGYSTDPIMSHFREYGFCDTLVKPYRFSDLSRIIASILD